jgi:hypothetical protein
MPVAAEAKGEASMSDRSQHQLFTVGAFAVGLLWVVSSLFGDGKEPGVIDKATQSVVHRLHTSSGHVAGATQPAYDLAVTRSHSNASEGENKGGWGNVDETATAPADFDTTADAGNPQSFDQPEGGAEDGNEGGNAETSAQPIDVGVIHK